MSIRQYGYLGTKTDEPKQKKAAGIDLSPSEAFAKTREDPCEQALPSYCRIGKEVLPHKNRAVTDPYDLGGDGKVYRMNLENKYMRK